MLGLLGKPEVRYPSSERISASVFTLFGNRSSLWTVLCVDGYCPVKKDAKDGLVHEDDAMAVSYTHLTLPTILLV